MELLQDDQASRKAENYATDFIKQLHMKPDVEQRCEWSCRLWSKDHWALQAQKAKIDLEQTKERLTNSRVQLQDLETLHINSQFLNTVAQIYSRLFAIDDRSCGVKDFPNCPYMGERNELLEKGALATVFATILHKATFYAMLDRHPLDSGLLDEEYKDVYGIDLTDYQDLENSLADGRFAILYESVVKRATELVGLRSTSI